MIHRWGKETGLLLVDVQRGVDDLQHWGGARGRRNNPQAETRITALLLAWRERSLPVYFTLHDSREADSPLKANAPGGAFKPGLEPREGEPVIRKDVNSGFIGTNLDLVLRRNHTTRLVVAGFFTNMCVASTVRTAGNMGWDTYLARDACACTNRIGPDGTDFDPKILHDITVATLHGEFCTSLTTEDVLSLTERDMPSLNRVQGNE